MNGQDLDIALQKFKRSQKRARIGFAILVPFVLLVSLSVLAYSSYQAKHARLLAEQELANALNATQKLNAIATDVLRRVRAIDEEGRRIANGESPTVYLWRAGLHPKKTVVNAADQRDMSRIIEILKDRKSLLSESGPLISTPGALQDYACGHIWYVVAESIHPKESKEYLAAEAVKDPRFAFAEIGAPNPPEWVPILIGFFLTQEEARKLKVHVDTKEHEVKIYLWDFGPYRPTCSA